MEENSCRDKPAAASQVLDEETETVRKRKSTTNYESKRVFKV